MENNPEPIKEILDELFSLLESLETQSLALTQLLKDQGTATDEKLAPYLDRAGNTSSVKWRAARARMQYLLSPIAKKADDGAKDKNKEPEKPQAEKQPTEKPSTEQNKPASPDATKDTAQNTGANTSRNPKPAAPKPAAKEDDKKSDSREKSNRK
jgi:chemotaxis protein histidine kinase CheA